MDSSEARSPSLHEQCYIGISPRWSKAEILGTSRQMMVRASSLLSVSQKLFLLYTYTHTHTHPQCCGPTLIAECKKSIFPCKHNPKTICSNKNNARKSCTFMPFEKCLPVTEKWGLGMCSLPFCRHGWWERKLAEAARDRRKEERDRTQEYRWKTYKGKKVSEVATSMQVSASFLQQ